MSPKKDGPMRRARHQFFLVASHGRVLERFRFRGQGGSEPALEHAFQHFGLADPAPEDEFPELEYEEVPNFLDICAELPSVDT